MFIVADLVSLTEIRRLVLSNSTERSYWPNAGVWAIMDFFKYFYGLSQGPGTKTFLTSQDEAHLTMLQTTYSLRTKDSS